MNKLVKYIGCFLLAAGALLLSNEANAQANPPAGGFKNAYLSQNKSGKVVLTYTLWD